jgi:hypothetical protein
MTTSARMQQGVPLQPGLDGHPTGGAEASVLSCSQRLTPPTAASQDKDLNVQGALGGQGCDICAPFYGGGSMTPPTRRRLLAASVATGAAACGLVAAADLRLGTPPAGASTSPTAWSGTQAICPTYFASPPSSTDTSRFLAARRATGHFFYKR